MRVVKVILKGLFVCIGLLGVSASGSKNPPPSIAVSPPAFEQSLSVSNPMVFVTPQRPRSSTDLWLMGLVALILVGHQMRRKHRFLRPHPFGL